MRILNRLAQRYLVRRATPLPQVGAPGPDPLDSAWAIHRAAVGGVFHILPYDDASRSLGAMAGRLVFDEIRSGDTGPGGWLLASVGDGTAYVRILDAVDPNRGLRADAPGPSALDLSVALAESSPDDPAAMWRIDETSAADARSIHLRYRSIPDAGLLYNEIYPQQAPPGTFFCTSGFGVDSRGSGPCGYGGIQRRADGSQIAIFSVWHRMADGETAVKGALATVGVHRAAAATAFSGEGSGSSIRFPLTWQLRASEPVRFAVTAEALGADTVLSGYVARGNEQWISLGSILRAQTGGRLLAKPYGFIEDFARTGNTIGVAPEARSPYLLRSGVFANPWVRTAPPATALEPIREAEVTVYSPHPLENVFAEAAPGVAPFGVLVATGTSQLAQPSPTGRTIVDTAAGQRPRPILAGVV